MKAKKRFWQFVSPMKLILGGYCLLIILGTLLLALPVATKGAGSTPLSDCFFTATSATCVTGLVRYDTFQHWTLFGQLVILGLIQVGGIGFVTVAILILMLSGKKISLSQRALMQNSISAPQLGGIVSMTRYIAVGTLVVEAVGAILLSVDFIPRFGPAKGIYYSIFHSISAFCNAGFDLMGGITGECSSLTGMVDNWYVNIVIMALIVVGGIGFFVWKDLQNKKFRFRKLRLQSKLVLSVSGFLIVFGAVIFLILESADGMFQGMSWDEKILASLFQSVTTRTAGFNTTDYTKMTESGVFFMICLMLVGGSTGSTAGGMKTTTLSVLLFSVFATFGKRKNMEAFGRRMEEGITRTASCIFVIYLFLTTSVAMIISAIEQLPFLTCLFETVSAAATVGLTLGITPSVGMVSKLLLAFLMICGRVGSVTVLMAFASDKKAVVSRLPEEKVQVG